MVGMYYKYAAKISSNGSNFLTAWFLVTEFGYICTKLMNIMHPGQPSEARLGGVQLTFCHIQILFSLLQVELFRGYYVYCMHI